MRLYTEPVEVQSEGEFAGGESRIKASAHAFAVLSKGLYSDAHLAIVRELSCNAWDSHIAAGNTDKKFDLYLPNTLVPIFKVRDYGTGLESDAAVLKMYDYFDSSKQQSDTMTGCFGLGAKSPYAYTKKFTTINYFNGKASHFISFLNEKGIPDTLKMSETDTTEPNGLEISFSVEPDDFYHFERAARQALRPFKFPPNIHGVYNPESFLDGDSRGEPVLTGPNWKLFRNDHHGYGNCTAIMGNVAYPMGRQVRKGMSLNAQKMLGFDLDIEFPLGAFEITPSREQVQWTDYTVNNINDQLEAIFEVVLAHVNTKIQGAPTLWEANIAAQELQRTQFSSFITLLTWQGKEINGAAAVHPSFRLAALVAGAPRYDRNGDVKNCNSVETTVCGPKVKPNRVKFYFGDYKGSTNKIENHVRHDLARGEKLYYIQYMVPVFKTVPSVAVPGTTITETIPTVSYDKSKLQEFCDQLGIDIADVKMVSSIPDRPREERQYKGRLVGSKARAFTFKFNKYLGEQNDRYWDEAEIDLTACTEGVYVEIGNWKLRGSKYPEAPYRFFECTEKLANLNFAFPDNRLVGVKTADVEKFQKAANWKTLDAHMAKQMADVWADKSFQRAFKILKCEDDSDLELEDFYHEICSLPELPFKNCAVWPVLLSQLNDARKHFARVRTFKDCFVYNLDPALDKELATVDPHATELVELSLTRYPLLTAFVASRRHYHRDMYPHLDAIVQYVQLIDKEVPCPSSLASI